MTHYSQPGEIHTSSSNISCEKLPSVEGPPTARESESELESKPELVSESGLELESEPQPKPEAALYLLTLQPQINLHTKKEVPSSRHSKVITQQDT